MTFTPFSELSEAQQQAVAQKWPHEKPQDYTYNFLGDNVTPYARRTATSAEANPGAPAPGGVTCEKCGRNDLTPKGAGPHRKHCKGGLAVAATPQVTEQTAAAITAAAAGLKEAVAAAAPAFISGAQKLAEGFAHLGRAIVEQIVEVPLVCLVDSPTQPRTDYDTQKHEELVASMRAHKWVKAWPALVRPIDGPAAEAQPIEPHNPDGLWDLCEPGTMKPLFPGRTYPREEAERLAAITYAHRFELIFGHRRTRAARAVGLEFAPVVIQSVSDKDALELQLIENLRRHDLNPIEEAEHLARLLSLPNETGKPAHTKESLAHTLGVSLRHISQALSLCALEGDVRKAVASGTLGVALGYELARIPDAEIRAKAANEILNPSEGEGPMRHRAAVDYIRRECTRPLREARFDAADAELVPVRFKMDNAEPGSTENVRYMGGSCLDCVYNSAFSTEPGKTGPKLGLCANIACFALKTEADFERFRAQNSKPEEGKLVFTFERNKEVFDAEGEVDWKTGLVPLNEAPDPGLLKAGALPEGEQPPTWKQLTKGKVGEVLIARHPTTGKRVELIDLSRAKQAAELNQHHIFRTSRSQVAEARNKGNDDAHQAATLAARREKDVAGLTLHKLLGEVAGKAAAHGHLPGGGFECLAFWALEVVKPDALATVARRRSLEQSALGDYVARASEPERLGMLVELVLADHWHSEAADLAAGFANVFGVKIADVRERARAEVDAQAAVKMPETETWRALQFTTTEIENAFSFNASGICEKPDALLMKLPEEKKNPVSVRLEAAMYGDAWICGYHVENEAFGAGAPVSLSGRQFGGRFAAFAEAARLAAARINTEERVSRKARAAMQAAVTELELQAAGEAHVAQEASPEEMPVAEALAPQAAHLTEFPAPETADPTPPAAA